MGVSQPCKKIMRRRSSLRGREVPETEKGGVELLGTKAGLLGENVYA